MLQTLLLDEAGVRVGDPIVPLAPFQVLASGRTYLAKAFYPPEAAMPLAPDHPASQPRLNSSIARRSFSSVSIVISFRSAISRPPSG